MTARTAAWLPLVLAIGIYLGGAFWLASVKAPWCDEAWFANPAYNLAFKGKMSSNLLEPSGHYLNAYLSGIQERTYIVVPNHLIALAGWFSAFGFSWVTMRAFSICWGAIQLLLIFYILKRLFADLRIAQITVLLLSVDFVYLWTTADGRMEAGATTLALACIASWLHWKDRDIGKAVLISQLFGAAAVFTHPNALLGVIATCVIALRFEFKRLRWTHLFLAGAPYCLFLLAWSVYILESPSDFKAQFFANAAGRESSRWKNIVLPWRAAWYELIRHLGTYASSSLWAGTMKGWFVFVPILYLCAVIRCWRKSRAGDAAISSLFLTLTLTYVLGLTFLNGLKAPIYFLYLLPWYNASLAIWLKDKWTNHAYDRLVCATIACTFLALEISTTVQHIQANEYGNYLAAVDSVKQYHSAGKTITAQTSLGAAFDFEHVNDDARLGMFSGHSSDVIVYDRSYRLFAKLYAEHEPAVFDHVATTLLNEYHPVYLKGPFWIFERNSSRKLQPVVLQGGKERADELFNALAQAVPQQARNGSILP